MLITLTIFLTKDNQLIQFFLSLTPFGFQLPKAARSGIRRAWSAAIAWSCSMRSSR